MASGIDTKAKRDRLKPRREPYWSKVQAGAYVGYRRTPEGGTWIARYRDEDGKQKYHALTLPEHQPANVYDAAVSEARTWFSHMTKGGQSSPSTVKAACERYVERLRADPKKGATAADDAAARFRRHVYSDAKFAGTELQKLSKPDVQRWQKALVAKPVKLGLDPTERKRSESAINRDMTSLRAALNLAYDDGYSTSDHAWRLALRPIKGAGRRRTAYLPLADRRALVSKAGKEIAAFLRGLSLLPFRPGALAALTVANFDKRLSTLRVGKDKSGADRALTLPPATSAFFVKQSKDKLPGAPLFTALNGGHWNKDSWKGPIKEAVAAANLPANVTAYTLRHSVITDLVAGGLDLMTVAQLSATSVAIIEKHYSHLQQDHARNALAKLKL